MVCLALSVSVLGLQIVCLVSRITGSEFFPAGTCAVWGGGGLYIYIYSHIYFTPCTLYGRLSVSSWPRRVEGDLLNMEDLCLSSVGAEKNVHVTNLQIEHPRFRLIFRVMRTRCTGIAWYTSGRGPRLICHGLWSNQFYM